jgi:hypothetical protein
MQSLARRRQSSLLRHPVFMAPRHKGEDDVQGRVEAST